MDFHKQDLGRMMKATVRDVSIFFGSPRPKNTFKKYGTEVKIHFLITS
jgi:hypothetical protein